MRRAVVGKRSCGVKGVREGGPLVKNSRIPESAGRAGGASRTTVAAGAPSPFNGIASLNCDRFRRKTETIAADHHRDSSRACCRRAKGQNDSKSQDRSDDEEPRVLLLTTPEMYR